MADRQRSRPDTRPLNAPRPIPVRADERGWPLAIRKPAWPRELLVARVRDRWRTDDEWWRAKPISRLYHELVPEDGARLTVYHDLVGDAWYEQRDGGTRP